MSALKRLLREPLLHFLVAGAAIFYLYQAVSDGQDGPAQQITVTQDQIARLAALWEQMRQRPPTAAELKGLVEDHIEEEIYYRQALALGLDRDDTVIRRRLHQKMAFLNAGPTSAPEPSDAKLTAYFERHADTYRVEPKLALRHIYLSIDKRGAAAAWDAQQILQRVKAPAQNLDLSALGDPTQLPAEIPLSPKSEIARVFGPAFAEYVAGLDRGQWSGPVRSGYGLHLVLVQQRVDRRLPGLDEVREAVMRDWRIEQRRAERRERFERLKEPYTITIEWPKTMQETEGADR